MMFNNSLKYGLTFFSGGVALGGVPLDSRENLQSSKRNRTRSVKNTAWKTILSFWNGPLSRGQLVRFLDCKARCYPIRGRCWSRGEGVKKMKVLSFRTPSSQKKKEDRYMIYSWKMFGLFSGRWKKKKGLFLFKSVWPFFGQGGDVSGQ